MSKDPCAIESVREDEAARRRTHGAAVGAVRGVAAEVRCAGALASDHVAVGVVNRERSGAASAPQERKVSMCPSGRNDENGLDVGVALRLRAADVVGDEHREVAAVDVADVVPVGSAAATVR